MNFEDEAEKLRRGLSVWDDRSRFLGIFQMYNMPKDVKLPWGGIGDHLQSCQDCDAAGGTPHPKIHAIFAYIRLGTIVMSVSWPTWWDGLFS